MKTKKTNSKSAGKSTTTSSGSKLVISEAYTKEAIGLVKRYMKESNTTEYHNMKPPTYKGRKRWGTPTQISHWANSIGVKVDAGWLGRALHYAHKKGLAPVEISTYKSGVKTYTV